MKKHITYNTQQVNKHPMQHIGLLTKQTELGDLNLDLKQIVQHN